MEEKSNPDILAVAETDSSNSEISQWYYMKDGILTKIVDVGYTKRAKRIAINKFQLAEYDNSTGRWHFSDLIFNPKKNEYDTIYVKPTNPSQVIKNWPNHWQ